MDIYEVQNRNQQLMMELFKLIAFMGIQNGRLCLMEESEENLRARYEIILKQQEEAYKRVEEAKATAKYMDDKVAYYEAILAGLAPDDTNPKNWTAENRPKHGA